MTDQQDQKIKAALDAARNLLTEVTGVDAIAVMIGVDTGPEIAIHVTVSGNAYILTKLIYEGAPKLLSSIRQEAPEVVRVVESECWVKLAGDMKKLAGEVELMGAKTDETFN